MGLRSSHPHCTLPSLLQLLADVYIFTDHMTGAASGASPGYGITLVAETTSGRLLAAEAAAALDRGGAAGAAGAAADAEEVVPEDIGQRAAHLLLEEIQRGGVVDSSHQVRCALLCCAVLCCTAVLCCPRCAVLLCCAVLSPLCCAVLCCCDAALIMLLWVVLRLLGCRECPAIPVVPALPLRLQTEPRKHPTATHCRAWCCCCARWGQRSSARCGWGRSRPTLCARCATSASSSTCSSSERV